MYSNIDEQFKIQKQEFLKSFREEFKTFKEKYRTENIAEIDFEKKLREIRKKLDEIIIDEKNYNDNYKAMLLHEFFFYHEKFNNPLKLFFEEKFSELKNKQKENIIWKEKHNKKEKYDISFFEKKGYDHIVNLFAKKYAIEDYLNYFEMEDEEIETIKKVDFDLIELNFPESIKTDIIKLMYNSLNEKYINIEFKLFERHFINNYSKKTKIEWIDKNRGTLKAFLDEILRLEIIKNSHINLLGEMHFCSKSFSLNPNNFKTAKNTRHYKEICDEKNINNKIVQLIKLLLKMKKK